MISRLLTPPPNTIAAKAQEAVRKGDFLALAALSMKAAHVYQRAIDRSRKSHYDRCTSAWELAKEVREFAFSAAISINPEDAPKALHRAGVLATRTVARSMRSYEHQERARRVSLLFAYIHNALERLYASR